jgi:protoporphyrinogen oxidase
MDTQHPYIILGAGISGLSLGWVLKSLSVPFLIIEKSNSCGGVIQGL